MIPPTSRQTIANRIELLEARIAPAALATLKLGDLNGVGGFKLQGESGGDNAGHSVSNAGDVNGDGFDDLIVGAYLAGSNVEGAAYVVFGKNTGFSAWLDLSSLTGANGFKLQGEGSFTFTGASVSAAGDVNGDGIDDLIIGATDTAPNGNDYAGTSYVVFGKNTAFGPTLALSSLNGTNGFKIQGESAYDYSGTAVSAAGDLNGDGFDDLIIGAEPYNEYASARVGLAYVVFGKGTTFSPSLNLSDLDGTTGFKIRGETPSDNAGSSVSAAGDVNGDGMDDIIIGANGAKNQYGTSVGASYVIYGKSGTFSTTLDLSSLDGIAGFKILGDPAGDSSGSSVSSAGDVNGDGHGDIIIGAREPNTNTGKSPGTSFVIYGKTGTFASPLDLSKLDGKTGFKILGAGTDNLSGGAVSGAGDVNGDGFDDLLIGEVFKIATDTYIGSSYVVFGKAGGLGTKVDLSSLNGSNGFGISGIFPSDTAGNSVSGAGDVNGDGFDDLLIGAEYADPHGSASGESYVVFGGPHFAFATISKTGKSATFLDADGDLVTVKITKGTFAGDEFNFAQVGEGAQFKGLQLQSLDLHGRTTFTGGNITISAAKVKNGSGDGLANVGALQAAGIDLGTVSVSGDLGQIDAGDTELTTPAAKGLTAGSLGAKGASTQASGTSNPLQSDFTGGLGKLTVKRNVTNAVILASGAIGPVSIGGDLDGSGGGAQAGFIKSETGIGAVKIKGSVFGGADFTGLVSGGKLGKVTVSHSLVGLAAKPVTISAFGKINATKAADALAIAGLTVTGELSNARILAGYDAILLPLNPDAGIGPINVGGNWSGASVAAGVEDTSIAGTSGSPADGFGRNDTLIAGLGVPTIVASIASITIKGGAGGTPGGTDFFGIVAQKIGKVSILRTTIVPTGADTPLDLANGDFHLVTL